MNFFLEYIIFFGDYIISEWFSLSLSKEREHISAFYDFKENTFTSLHLEGAFQREQHSKNQA